MRYLIAQADRQIEAKYAKQSLAEDAFLESFLSGILFYGQAVLSDIYCFISTSLSRALWDVERAASIAPLVRLALAKGLLIPAFRSTDSTFLGNYKVIQEQRIQGVQRLAEATARQLDTWLSANPSPEIIRWPTDMSIRYRDVIDSTIFFPRLDDEEVLSPQASAELASLRAYLDKKDKSTLLPVTSSTTNRGLRRGDLYNWLYSSEFGELPRRPDRESHGIDDVTELLGHPKCLADPALQAILFRLLGLIDYLYAFNKAKALNVDVYFSGLDELAHLFVWNAARRLPTVPAITAPQAHSTGTFSCTVCIPSVRHLLAVPPEDLIAIRRDAGEGYFELLTLWHSDPSRYEEDLRRCLITYARDLSSRVRGMVPVVDIMLNKVRYSDRARLRDLSPLLDSLLQPSGPKGKVFLSALRPLSNILYSFASERQVRVQHSRPGYIL